MYEMKVFLDVYNDENALAKALAYFMFTDIIENLYDPNIDIDSQLAELNKEVCNRAEVFLKYILPDKNMKDVFLVESRVCTDWDAPEMTDSLKKRVENYEIVAEMLKSMRKELKGMTKEERRELMKRLQ